MQENRNDPEQAPDLIGYHLGLCDQAERAAVEKALAADPSYAKLRASLDRLLVPLDADDAPQPPADLVQRILQRAYNAPTTLPLRPMSPAMEGRETSGGPRFSLRELLSLAACIAMFVGIFVPGYRAARYNSQQAMCASNLGKIGNSIALYGESNERSLPFVSSLPLGASWVATEQRGVPRVSNSQNAFQLISGRYVLPSAFVCPGREEDRPLAHLQPERLSDFPDPRNNSYSTELVTESWKSRPFDPNAPLAADLTPLVDGQRRLLPAARITLNSTSHAGRGQNVLRNNLSVIFSPTPNVGIDNDDIYRVIGVQQYTGMERPKLRSDAFLVP